MSAINLLFLILSVVITVLHMLFFLFSLGQKWEASSSSSFECGFSSYFFSHYSFSIHYYMVAMIFLFLDLELCVIMPLMNESLKDFVTQNLLIIMVFILLIGLLWEWYKGKLEWIL